MDTMGFVSAVPQWELLPLSLLKLFSDSKNKKRAIYFCSNLYFRYSKILFIYFGLFGKQPKCPSTDVWIKKRWYVYTMEYYSAILLSSVS